MRQDGVSTHDELQSTYGSRALTFIASASGRACLSNWAQPLAVSDILNLLLDLKQTMALARRQVLLILVIRQSVPVPAEFFLNSLQAAMPAILDCCSQLVPVVEATGTGTGTGRAWLRAVFETTGRTIPGQTRPQIFDSLSTALAHAQRLAPHDVLELQRLVLRHSFPPHGHWT